MVRHHMEGNGKEGGREMRTKAGIMSMVFGLAFALQAAVIYQDDFTKIGRVHPGETTTQVLKASTPFNATTDGQWWKSHWNSANQALSIQSAGTLRTGSADLRKRGAFLDFTPESGKIYTLSVDMSVAGATAGTGFLAMGFSANTLHIDDYATAQAAWDAGTAYTGGEYTDTIASALGGWKLNVNNTSSTFKDSGYAGALAGGAPTAGYNTFKTVLDTRGDNWTVEWLLNGTSIRTETYDTNPTIRNVFLGVDNVLSGTYQNFSLTVVPEPATLGMLGLGSIGVVLFRRLSR
jgi:hypothetical protein